MSNIVERSDRRTPEEILEEKKALTESEREMATRMSQVKVYPGDLEEVRQLTGLQIEPILLEGGDQFIQGRLFQWQALGSDPDVFSSSLGYFLRNLGRIRKVKFKGGTPDIGREILQKTVELGGNALVHHRYVDEVLEEGVPVRLIDPEQIPQA